MTPSSLQSSSWKSNKHFKDNTNTWSIHISSSIKKSHLPNEFKFQLFISLREVDFFWQIIPNFVSRINFLLAPSYSYPTITYIIFQHELFFPLALQLLHTEIKFLLDLNYSCPTDTSTIIVPTVYLLLQLSFTVSKRSSLSRTKVPHQIIRDLLSSESFSSESAFLTVKV